MEGNKVMKEFNLLCKYPQPEERLIPTRTIEDRILASYRGHEFFDGARTSGYGGMKRGNQWKATAGFIQEIYKPRRVVQFACEKGYLLADLHDLGIAVVGVESSAYARSYAPEEVKMVPALPVEHLQNPFDLAIALGLVYTCNLHDAMNCIRMMERVAHQAFITLAAYDTEEDLRLFRKWTLLGTTILKRDEWIEVLKHCGYTGDYWFITADYLRLRESS
jgi:hypothetical protein